MQLTDDSLSMCRLMLSARLSRDAVLVSGSHYTKPEISLELQLTYTGGINE